MKISFVIPCYRSEKTIEGVVGEIKSVVAQRPEVDYEIIMVSDHSPDNVYAVIEKMCHADPRHLKGVELAKNFGQHAALMAGYARTSGDYIYSLDDDGQAPLDATFALLDKLIDGKFDSVCGVYQEVKQNLFRRLGSWVNDKMAVWLIGKPRGVRLSSFCVMRRFLMNAIIEYKGPFPYLAGLTFRATRNFGIVEVNHRARASGNSGYSFQKLLALWMNGFTAFSIKPLRLATWMGFGCAALGFGYGFWTVIRKLFIEPNALLGYSSIMATILFIGGMLMLILGLIGEYIGRIYICINKSPQYVISKETT